MPGDCLDCCRRVVKNARALRCSLCKEWCHAACGGLEEEDYLFMTRRGKSGFRWYCLKCVADADDADSKEKAVDEMMEKFRKVESLVFESMEEFGVRLDDLEKKCGTASPQARLRFSL